MLGITTPPMNGPSGAGIERHPVTGAAQLVELPERVEVPSVPRPVSATAPVKPLLFAGIGLDRLLLGAIQPREAEWLDAVRRVDEDSLFDIVDKLPQEAAEALLDLATGAPPER